MIVGLAQMADQIVGALAFLIPMVVWLMVADR